MITLSLCALIISYVACFVAVLSFLEKLGVAIIPALLGAVLAPFTTTGIIVSVPIMFIISHSSSDFRINMDDGWLFVNISVLLGLSTWMLVVFTFIV